MIFLFAGGGTLGPVTPLLAVAEALKKMEKDVKFYWVGTPGGPERELVESKGFIFYGLPVAKMPRYLSAELFRFPLAYWQAKQRAKKILQEIKPDAVVTVGGFTAVPIVSVAAAAGIPCFTHQLDLVPGLANKRIAKWCASVTTSFEYERPPFGDRVFDERISTPTRFSINQLLTKAKAAHVLGLDPSKSIVWIWGGGTGAQGLNEMVERTLGKWLEFTQVIHLTGQGKGMKKEGRGYVQKAFFKDEMLDAYAAADLIICRAGVGSLSEMAALKKAFILVPMPDSHQEANAQAFEERGAAVVMSQKKKAFDEELLESAKLLLEDAQERKAMGERANIFFPTDDGRTLAQRILLCLKQEGKILPKRRTV
ncbi:MAG: UDP-N-acetylglucosamine--N-acetylmuramyl-(pentapeptide) pyrophosphoryl-undecaprenol N-acetylglucosamine transferase [bacterium]|nr:UDP-N-acetylglucosamine--N-acetylmuramyl-(pentapeptide) pyrophosphoryl-undecaprenol N-acetylglucosamine transferase [bacterium]